jgi:hypothetical protein
MYVPGQGTSCHGHMRKSSSGDDLQGLASVHSDRLKWTVAFMLAASAAGLYLARSGTFRADPDVAEYRALLARHRAKYQQLEVRPFESLSEADIEACFAQGSLDWVEFDPDARNQEQPAWRVTERPGWIQGTPPVDAHRTLARMASQFLWRQFGSRDPAAYRAWREAHHATRRPLSEVLADTGERAGAAYAAHFGSPPPPDARFEDVFDRLWIRCQEQPGGRSKVVGMACGGGTAISIGWIPPRAGRARPQLLGALGAPAWYAGGAGTMRSWYQRSREWEAASMGRGGWCAEVGIIAEFEDGVRRPIILTYFYSTSTGRWSLDLVNYYDIGEGSEIPWSLEY